MSFRLIGLISALCIVACSAGRDRYENPVPLQIGGITEIKCDLPSVSGWKFKGDQITMKEDESRPKKHELLDNNKLLKIHRGDYNDEGNYTCESESGQKLFVVKGKPRFKITTSKGRIDVKSIHANEGTEIDMICFIPNKAEIPQEEQYDFQWYKGDTVASALVEKGRQNTLQISAITQTDRDMYSCFADNGVQNHTEYIRLRVKDKLSYIWPMIGIVCELVILAGWILIFEKRGVKPEFEESDNDANTDVKKSS